MSVPDNNTENHEVVLRELSWLPGNKLARFSAAETLEPAPVNLENVTQKLHSMKTPPGKTQSRRVSQWQWKDCAAENENLKLQVLQLNSLQIENDLLKQENVDCKGKILQLEEDNKALKKVNDELSIENRIFLEKLQVGFSSKHNKNRKKKTKKPSKTKKRKHSSSDSSTSSSDSG